MLHIRCKYGQESFYFGQHTTKNVVASIAFFKVGGGRAGQVAKVDFNEPLIQDRVLSDGIIDFLNNEIGREIGERVDGNSIDFANEIINVFQNEGLWTMSTDEKGNIKIQRTKISKEQADNARQTLNTLDNNGFNEEDRTQLEGGN
ncbi:MAG: hypothetical protein AAF849_02405 [Bacteroidota bacterium]